MPDPARTYLILAGAAFLAGVLNSVAGGGTLLTFPALTAVVPGIVANATSTVALLPGSFAGALGFRNEFAAGRRFVLRMIPPSLAGGLLGAWLASRNPAAFDRLVPWLVLLAAVLFLAQTVAGRAVRRSAADPRPAGPRLAAGLVFAQFLIAIYGGYFGAGIGILMLTALGFLGVGDIHRMNGVKTFLAAVINAASVVVFVGNGQVDWHLAGVMAGAAVAGGYAGARVSRRLPAPAVRWAVVAIAFGLSAYYFAREYGGD